MLLFCKSQTVYILSAELYDYNQNEEKVPV